MLLTIPIRVFEPIELPTIPNKQKLEKYTYARSLPGNHSICSNILCFFHNGVKRTGDLNLLSVFLTSLRPWHRENADGTGIHSLHGLHHSLSLICSLASDNIIIWAKPETGFGSG